MHHHSTIFLLYLILILFSFSCMDFLHTFSLFLVSEKWHLGHNPLCFTATISAGEKGGLGRGAVESPTHNAHTSAALSSSTPPLHQVQMLLFVLEMTLFSMHWCPFLYMKWTETLIFFFFVDWAPSCSGLGVRLWLEVSMSKNWAKENLFAYCSCKGLHENVSDCTHLQLLICCSR